MQARVFVAQRALEEGRGGVSRLARLTGMSRPTILKGIADLQGKVLEVGVETGRIRQPGGGRKPVEAVAPALERALDRILAETTAGDPMSALRWTNKSTRTLAAELTRQGHAVSHVTVARCLHEMGYSLQANVKAVEGTGVRILDTRKTTPGLRFLEKHAALAGGAGNHRFGSCAGAIRW